MLKAKLSTYYRSQKTGQIVFVYFVTGSEEEMAAFEVAKKSYFRKDADGNVLHFSPRALSNNRAEVVNLTITSNGNIVADDLNKVLSQNEKLEDYILKEQAKVLAIQALSRGGMRNLTDLTASQPGLAPTEFTEAVEVTVGSEVPV